MDMRPINRMMPWIACGSAAILASVLFLDLAGPAEQPVVPEPPPSETGVSPLDLPVGDPAEPALIQAPAAGPAAEPVAEPVSEPPPALVAPRPERPRARIFGPKAARPATRPPLEEPPDVTPPELVVVAPSGPEFSLRAELRVRARSEPGARVAVSGRTLAEGPAGVFSGRLRLAPGANELRVTAEDAAGNRAARLVRVTCVDLDRIGHDRQRIERMVGQLEDIRAAASELDRRILELLARMREVADAAQIARLSDELRLIRQTRRVVGQELSNALGQVDSLLAVAP